MWFASPILVGLCRFLKQNGLLGHEVKNGIVIDPASLMWIDIQFVQ